MEMSRKLFSLSGSKYLLFESFVCVWFSVLRDEMNLLKVPFVLGKPIYQSIRSKGFKNTLHTSILPDLVVFCVT